MWDDPVHIINRAANRHDPRIRAFLNDVLKVYKEHGLALDRTSPEDVLFIREIDENEEEWLFSASDTTHDPDPN